MRNDLWVLFTRPFWLDEWHTILVARRDSLQQVFSDLYNGSDFGPPLTHIIAWSYGRIFGLTPVSLRLLALTFVVAGLVLLFFALRRRFDTMPSLAGVLAVASHQLIVSQSLEWRFYAPWVVFGCALVWAFTIDNDKHSSRRRDVAIAVASMGMVTSHWFGVITLGLMTAGAFIALSPGVSNWRNALRRVLPTAAGFVTFAICFPLMLGQRGSVVEKSWMPDFTIGQLWVMLRIFWFAFVPAVGILLALAAMLIPSARDRVRAAVLPTLRDPAVAAMLALLVMPLILAVISLKQPAMLPRYNITMLLAWAPIIAFGLNALPRIPRAIALVWLALLGYSRVIRVGIEQRGFTVAIAAGQQAASTSCSRGVPILFHVRHLMYPSTEGSNHAGCDLRYLSISNETLAAMYPTGNMQRFFRIENEFSEMHGRMYGYPVVAREAQMDSARAFLLVGWDASLPQGYKDIEKFRAAVFPQHHVTRLTENLALFELGVGR
jgi:hypothetical protein